MAEKRDEIWAERVGRWKASGLTAKEFASRNGLNASTLTYWCWRLRAQSVGDGGNTNEQRVAKAKEPRPRKSQSRSRKPPVTAGTPRVAQPAFVEVPVTTLTTPLEVVFACGVRVQVPAGVDEDTLARVVRVLEAKR